MSDDAQKTPIQLAQELLELRVKATPGSWGTEDADNDHIITAGTDAEGAYIYVASGEWNHDDVPFIAHAGTHAEAICRALIAAEERVACLEMALHEAQTHEIENAALHDIQEALAAYPCRHDAGPHRETPAMMYPELLACIIGKAINNEREKATEALESQRQRIREGAVEEALAMLRSLYNWTDPEGFEATVAKIREKMCPLFEADLVKARAMAAEETP